MKNVFKFQQLSQTKTSIDWLEMFMNEAHASIYLRPHEVYECL